MLTVIAVVVMLMAVAAGILSYGRFARRLHCEHSTSLAADRVETDLDRCIAPLTAAHPEDSGLALLSDNVDAFALRALTARHAGRSLDLQYYIWKKDLTGELLAAEIVRAAERGVRVRILLDDVNVHGLDPHWLAIDRHERIEVRLFNPSRNRDGMLRRALEMLLRWASLNRRMHNKAWIADGRVAIVGGRNIGDAYFDAADLSNFQDLDLLALGPVVQQAATAFDIYWNSTVALPIAGLHPRRGRKLAGVPAALGSAAGQAAAKPFLARVAQSATLQELLAGHLAVHWTREVELVCDPPAKAHGRRGENWIMNVLRPAIASARSDLQVISPYFVPGTLGAQALAAIAADGVAVSILTNSLAATDVAVVHAGYARYRRRLVEAGIRLFELKPALRQRLRLFGSRGGASLHTKAFVVDRRAGFVGSFNFDPRSVSLNTEMGLLFVDPPLAEALHQIFVEQTAADASFRVEVRDGQTRWVDAERKPPRIWIHEPIAGVWRRLACSLLGFLPIESQL